MHGDQVGRPQKDIDFLGANIHRLDAEGHGVEDEVEIAAIVVQFRQVGVRNGILDCQRMEVKGVFQDRALFGRIGCQHVHPEHAIVRLEQLGQFCRCAIHAD